MISSCFINVSYLSCRRRFIWLRTRWSGVRISPGAPINQRVSAVHGLALYLVSGSFPTTSLAAGCGDDLGCSRHPLRRVFQTPEGCAAASAASARMSQARHAGRPGTELDTTRTARPDTRPPSRYGSRESMRELPEGGESRRCLAAEMAADSIQRSSRRANDDQFARQENP